MYTYKTSVRMHQTDAAGVIFFAELFTLAHDCYETFLSQEVTIKEIVNDKPFIIPIVHASADYKQPLGLSENITINMTCVNCGTSSFTLNCQILKENGSVAAEVKTVHAIVNKESRTAAQIPFEINDLLLEISV